MALYGKDANKLAEIRRDLEPRENTLKQALSTIKVTLAQYGLDKATLAGWIAAGETELAGDLSALSGSIKDATSLESIVDQIEALKALTDNDPYFQGMTVVDAAGDPIPGSV